MRKLFLLTTMAPALFAQTTLEETVVVASRIEEETSKTAGSSTAVTAEDIIESGGRDLVDILQREPGVSIPFDLAGVDGLVPYLEGGSKAINVRGLEGNRVNIQIDGIRQPEDFVSRSFLGSGGPGRVYFDPAVFSQVEIFKSASSNLYGSDALAGTVSGRTESPFTLLGPSLDGATLRTNTTYATANDSLHERFAAAVGNGDHAASVVYSYRLGHENENNSDLPANPVDFQSHAIVAKTASRFNDLTVEPTLEYFHLDSDTKLLSVEGQNLNGTTLGSTNDSERERFRASIDLIWKPSRDFLLADEISLKGYYQESEALNFNQQRLLIAPGTPNETIRDRLNDLFYKTDIAGADLQLRKAFSTGPLAHTLQAGYDFSRSEVSSALTRTDLPADPEALVNMAPAEVLRNGLSFSNRVAIGNAERVIITPSIRLEDYRVNPDNTDEFLRQTEFTVFDAVGRPIGRRSIEAEDYDNFTISPSLNFLVNITDSLNFYATTSRGFRNPSAEELTGVFQHEDDFITLPNPDLEEESSFSNEIGIQYDNDAVSFQLAGYWNFYDDFLESSVTTGEFLEGREIQRTVNRDEVEIYGAEAKADWLIGDTFPSMTGLSVGGSVGYSEGYSDDPTEGREPLNSVEPWKATAWVGYQHPSEKWGLNLTSSYHAGKDLADISGDLEPTQDYTLIDLTGYYAVSDNVTVRAGVKNLLDQEYILWSRANRGSGHGGSSSNGRDTRPGINGFLGVEFKW